MVISKTMSSQRVDVVHENGPLLTATRALVNVHYPGILFFFLKLLFIIAFYRVKRMPELLRYNKARLWMQKFTALLPEFKTRH